MALVDVSGAIDDSGCKRLDRFNLGLNIPRRIWEGRLLFFKSLAIAIIAGASTAALAQDNAPFAELEAAIENGDFGQVTSVHVQRGDTILFERHFDGNSADTLRNTRSVTKTITGALVGIAIEEGLIESLDAPVMGFFPDYEAHNPDPRKSGMTLRDLITMTGPLECNDWNNFSRGNEERMYLVEDWVGFFLDLPIGAPPPWEPKAGDRPFGKVYSYCTAGVFTLGAIVERVSGMQLEDYAREKLFQPLGIGDVNWPVSPLGIAQGGGGLEMSTGDLARFALLYVKDGMIGDRRILAEDWVAQSTKAAAQIDERTEYGYLWWLYDHPSSGAENSVWMMNGSGGNKVVALPDHDAVAVVTTTNFRRGDAHQLSERIIFENILPSLQD